MEVKVSGALALKARFPYMFEGRHAGLTFYRGWTPALSRVCEQIDDILPSGKHGFHWVQIGADQGSGLFVYVLGERQTLVADLQGSSRRALFIGTAEAGAAEISSKLDLLVLEAERVTSECCMVCGQRGNLSFHFGYGLTLCNAHPPGALNTCWEEGLQGFWRQAIEWEEGPTA